VLCVGLQPNSVINLQEVVMNKVIGIGRQVYSSSYTATSTKIQQLPSASLLSSFSSSSSS